MIDKSIYSPMMRQYLEIKEQNPGVLIFFRLGDFYELFFQDAITVSKELDLYLTGRDAGTDERVPMCGIPYHAINNYLGKLVAKGYKIGIAEQMEDPSLTKGLVRREIVQLLTPGTLIDVGLSEKENNYIACLEESFLEYTLAYSDMSTGETFVLSLNKDIPLLISELDSLKIREIIVSSAFSSLLKEEILRIRPYIFSIEDNEANSKINKKLLVNIKDSHQNVALCRLYNYLFASQKRELEYLKPAIIILNGQYLQMDNFTKNNLELVRTISSPDSHGSLYWLINKTKTAIGSRLLRKWILRPLNDLAEINNRLEAIEELIKNYQLRKELAIQLNEIYDLERIVGRIGFGNANPRDLLQLKKSIASGLKIDDLIKESACDALTNLGIKQSRLGEIATIIEAAINETPPITIKEGGIFKDGYNKELDELRSYSSSSKQFLAKLEIDERERTGIKNLKVAYNRVFGFYIEITKSNIPEVKDEYGYIRIQTLTNCERYKTEELKAKEDQILNAENKILQFEYELFQDLRETIKTETARIQKMADMIACVDVYYCLATIALDNNYVRPSFNQNRQVIIEEGRHPVVEHFTNASYIPNDWRMNPEDNVLIITGPNMGGKSTYMRQQALIIVLAQIGSFVPAKMASLPVFNKIFTRIGASDDLISGQSTFMVEMSEANNALRNADENSLIIFDEIGRGTSTYDGMALAQAIIEHIALKNKSKTLFSTHYHQLTTLAQTLPGIKNVSAKVRQENQEVVFLYKIDEGPASRSYGINVAYLAGLPQSILQRASVLLKELEASGIALSTSTPELVFDAKQEEEHPIVKELRKVNTDRLTPLEALQIIYQIKEKIK